MSPETLPPPIPESAKKLAEPPPIPEGAKPSADELLDKLPSGEVLDMKKVQNFMKEKDIRQEKANIQVEKEDLSKKVDEFRSEQKNEEDQQNVV